MATTKSSSSSKSSTPTKSTPTKSTSNSGNTQIGNNMYGPGGALLGPAKQSTQTTSQSSQPTQSAQPTQQNNQQQYNAPTQSQGFNIPGEDADGYTPNWNWTLSNDSKLNGENYNFIQKPTLNVNGQNFSYETPGEYSNALQEIQNRGGSGTENLINEYSSYQSKYKPPTTINSSLLNSQTNVTVPNVSSYTPAKSDLQATLNTPYNPPVSPIQGSQSMRAGNQGENVSQLQQFLNNNGSKLKVDGNFGPLTQQAVRQFQQANGLVADGIVGPQTLAALQRAGGAGATGTAGTAGTTGATGSTQSGQTNQQSQTGTTGATGAPGTGSDYANQKVQSYESQLQPEQNKYVKESDELMVKQAQEGADRAKLELEKQTAQKTSDINALELNMMQNKLAYAEQVKKIRENPNGSFGGAMNQDLQKAEIEYTNNESALLIKKALLSNDLQMVNSVIDKTLAYTYEPIKARLEYLKDFRERYYDELSSEKKSRLDSQLRQAEKMANPESISQKYGSGAIGEYNFVVEVEGYKGTFAQYQNEDANRKKSIARAGVGSSGSKLLSPTEAQKLGVPFGTTEAQAFGITSVKDATAAQQITAGYALRMKQANDQISKLQSSFTKKSIAGQAVSKVLPTWLNSADQQSMKQSERNFLNSVLRRESGAVISPSEFSEGAKQYFPRAGDTFKVLEQKKNNRDLVTTQIRNASGSAYDESFIPSENTNPTNNGSGYDEYSKLINNKK